MSAYLVLSIGGGGFKALACLRILAHLMELISYGSDQDAPLPRPCQIFDLICGTSAGGLIAIPLGRFGLSCGEAIDVCRELGATMFSGAADSRDIWKHIIEGGQSPSAIFEKKLEDLTEKYTGRRDAFFRLPRGAPDAVDHESAKTFVTIVSNIGSAGADAYRVRSCAPPLYEVDSPPYGHKWTVCEVATRVAKQLLDVATDTEISHAHIYEQFKSRGKGHNYHRFNPPQGLGDIELTDYRREAEIFIITDAWLNSPDGENNLSLAIESVKVIGNFLQKSPVTSREQDHPKVKQATAARPGPGAVENSGAI